MFVLYRLSWRISPGWRDLFLWESGCWPYSLWLGCLGLEKSYCRDCSFWTCWMASKLCFCWLKYFYYCTCLPCIGIPPSELKPISHARKLVVEAAFPRVGPVTIFLVSVFILGNCPNDCTFCIILATLPIWRLRGTLPPWFFVYLWSWSLLFPRLLRNSSWVLLLLLFFVFGLRDFLSTKFKLDGWL